MICAFCGTEENGTEEHVIPHWWYRANRERPARLNPNAGMITDRHLKVLDVCLTCNTGTLSKLDTAAKDMYNTYWRLEKVEDKVPISYRYNYDELARWVLKVGYNASRAWRGKESVAKALSRYKEYMLHGTRRPDRMALMTQIYSPTSLTDEQREAMKEELGDVSELPSVGFSVILPVVASSKLAMVGLSVNAWATFVMVPSDDISPSRWVREVETIRSVPMLRGAVLLASDESMATLTRSEVDFATARSQAMLMHLDAYIKRYGRKQGKSRRHR